MFLKNQIYIVILFALLLLSCVRGGMPNCSVNLEFKYDYNQDGLDKILEEVERIDLLIFSEDGSLCEQHFFHPQTDGTSQVLTLEGGTYHLVAWGNIPCPTRQDALYHYDIDLGKLIYEGEEIVFQDSIPGLFYGITTPFTIDGEKDPLRVVSLIKNTKQIDIVIRNSPFAGTRCGLFAGNCNHDNGNNPSELLNSIPKIEKVSDDVTYRFNTHRLLESDTLIKLEVFGKMLNEEEKSLTSRSLIDLLLENPEIDNLDRFDHYVIELIYGPYLHPIIKVNGWIVVDMDEDL